MAKRLLEGFVRNLRFEPHPGEYAARFSGEVHCQELGEEPLPIELHFEETSAVAHAEGVRLEYRSRRWYFAEGEFHVFIPVRLQETFEGLCFEADKTRELVEPSLFFAYERGAVAPNQPEARLVFHLGQTFVVEFAPA